MFHFLHDWRRFFGFVARNDRAINQSALDRNSWDRERKRKPPSSEHRAPGMLSVDLHRHLQCERRHYVTQCNGWPEAQPRLQRDDVINDEFGPHDLRDLQVDTIVTVRGLRDRYK